MSNIRCFICERQFDPQLSPAMPFCSERCRQIDLGRWLGESYSVPFLRQNEDEAEDAPRDLSQDGED